MDRGYVEHQFSISLDGKTTIRKGAGSAEALVVVPVNVLLEICLGGVQFFTSIALENINCCGRLGGVTGGLGVREDRSKILLGLSGTVMGCDSTMIAGGTMGDLYVKVEVGHVVVEKITTRNTTRDWARKRIVVFVNLSPLCARVVCSSNLSFSTVYCNLFESFPDFRSGWKCRCRTGGWTKAGSGGLS